MKTVCYLLILIPITAFSQRVPIRQWQGWSINSSNSLTWQSIFEDSATTTANITKTLKSLSWIRDVEVRDSTIFATAVGYIIDYSKYAKLSDSDYEGEKWNMAIRIDQKPGRYRVTVSNITFDSGFEEDLFHRQEHLSGTLESKVLSFDRTTIRTGHLNGLDVFSRALQENFSLLQNLLTEDW